MALCIRLVTWTLVALFVNLSNGFWVLRCPSRLVQDRIDPIVDPGGISSHVHTIAGGDAFAKKESYQDARGSKCSSCPIKQDLSAYWAPKLYYQAKNGSFKGVPQYGDIGKDTGGPTVYYLQRRGPNVDKLHAFPKGFRMVAGDPYKRNRTHDFAGQAISFKCLDYKKTTSPKDIYQLPNRNCPDGLRAQVFFPSCWDGKNVDSHDHKSHVAYPESGGPEDGPCPASHPKHLVSIFMETIFWVDEFANDWYGNSQPFVFSNGDPTGYSFHGDFLNGWDIDVLQKAVDHCEIDGDMEGNAKDCPYFDFYSDEECQNCSIKPVVNEEIDGPLEKLPGCNPVQSGPEEAQDHSKNCRDDDGGSRQGQGRRQGRGGGSGSGHRGKHQRQRGQGHGHGHNGRRPNSPGKRHALFDTSFFNF